MNPAFDLSEKLTEAKRIAAEAIEQAEKANDLGKASERMYQHVKQQLTEALKDKEKWEWFKEHAHLFRHRILDQNEEGIDNSYDAFYFIIDGNPTKTSGDINEALNYAMQSGKESGK